MEEDIEDTRKKITDMDVKSRTVTDPRDLSEVDQERFNALIIKSKKYVGEGRIEDALKMNKKALALCYSEKLAKKIKKMEDYLKQQEDESEDETGMRHLGKGFYLYKELHDKLYVHQQEGVLWLWTLFRLKKGGILGDDMGLGKTIQVIAFLSGMFDMQNISSVLIVLPVAVMVNWENEFKKWAPGLKVLAFHGNSKREKERALARVQRRGGICLTTYGLVVTSWDQLGTREGREFVWDYMILDEGHKIKNPTKTSKGVHAIPARHRIILTGTPVQNNLKELWALFDFVHQGSLLGTQRTFKMEYETPITRAREKDATSNEKKLGMEMAESLKRIISPFFLRRTKAEVKEREKNDTGEDKEKGKHAVMPTMTRKNDLIVWTFLGQTQLQIYQDFLHLDSVKELLMTAKSPLVALNVLKKICDHPRLLSTRACSQLGIEGDEGLDDDMLETEAGNLSAVTRIQHVADHILISESGKLVFLVELLDQLKREGHRCLVFSQSRKMLDIMQKVITNRGHKIMRLDGTISQVQEREQRIKKFQCDDSYSVFLLTTQVGGVGLTLTAADRVVIYDPSWNPATDAQAVDRVFRIGQNKNVVIYRLITCGTVEEKIYRRQVFKDSITRQTTGNSKNPYRYFSKYELRELFTLDDPKMSTTQQQLEEMHSGQRLTDPSLDEHIAFLYSLEMFGLSDHDLMFTQGKGQSSEDMSDDEHEVDQATENDYIQHRVQKAQQLLQMESQQEMALEERQGKHQAPQTVGASRNHMWEFPKPVKDDDNEEDSEHGESVSSDGEEEVNSESGREARPVDGNVTIDLTSPNPDRNRISNIKVEPNIEEIDLTTPVIKQERITHNIREDQSIESMEIGNTPKKHGTNFPLKIEDVDSINSEGIQKDVGNERANTPGHTSLVNERDMEVEEKGFELFTPKSKTVRESLFISPVKSEPIIQTLPSSSTSSASKNGKFGRRLNSAFFGLAEGSDIGSTHADHVKHGNKVAEDSPVLNSSSSGRPAIVEDSPNRSRVSDGGLSAGSRFSSKPDEEHDSVDDSMEESVINESVASVLDEMEHSHQGDISVHDVKSILEKSLAVSVDEDNDDADRLNESDLVPINRKVKARRSISARKPVIESSEEDDEGNKEDDNGLDDSEIVEHDGGVDVENVHHSVDDEDDDEGIDDEDMDQDLDNCDTDMIIDDGKDDLVDNRNINRSVNQAANKTTSDNMNDTEGKLTETDNSHRQVLGTAGKGQEGNIVEIKDDDENDDVENDDSSEESEDDDEEEEEEDEFHNLPEEEQKRYNELVEIGRALCAQRRYEEGQSHVLKALDIYPDPELQATAVMIQKKIMRNQMKAAMKGQS